ncbi:MAG: FeS-binding protein [Chloroflexi bacterium]|nr:FeS-binding protein [Chloroflexota bacterium]
MASRHVRLTFSPELIKEPLIYQMGHEFRVVTNIRMADVERSVGWVVLELTGDEEEIERSLAWARERGVRVDDATLGDVVEG